MRIVIDLSSWQDSYTFDKLRLLKENGVKACVIRAGCAHSEDDMLPTFVQWCRDLRMPFGLYFYFYPGLSLEPQVELFISLIEQYPDTRNVWVDVEEYKHFDSGSVYSPDFLNGFYKKVFFQLLGAFPDKWVGNYSGGWVLNAYIPKFYEWAKYYPYWNASYVKYQQWWKDFMASLGVEWDNDFRTLSISNLRYIMRQVEKHPVLPPNGMPIPDMWQCVTYIPFTELTPWQRHLDWNILPVLKYRKLFARTGNSIPPTPISKQYRVTAVALNIRDQPGGNIIGWLLYNRIVSGVMEGFWLHLDEGGYVYSDYVERVI